MLSILSKQLHEAYKHTVGNPPFNRHVRIERENGHDKLVVSNLDKLDKPPSLLRLREKVANLLPHVGLPTALLEVDAWTDFAGKFTPISGKAAHTGKHSKLGARTEGDKHNN